MITEYSNREEVLREVKTNGDLLYLASEELKNDKEIVFEAVTKCSQALWSATEEARNDFEIIVIAARKDSYVLACARKEFKKNKDIFKALEQIRKDNIKQNETKQKQGK